MFKKFTVAASATMLLSNVAFAADISGAGATFPAPVYAKWAETYKATTGTGLNYQAIGSGGGIKQIKAKTVDFGASDKPLKPEDLEAAGLYQFPTVVGGIVPIVNLPGIAPGQLKLNQGALAAIFLGQITKWNDPYIAEANKVWATTVGASDSVQWPVGLGGKGNDGVAAFVKQTSGSIGYVEYAYAKQNKATYAILMNASGKYVAPTAANFAAAAAGGDWTKAPGNYLLLLNQKGANAWPITGATFILVYKDQADANKGKEVLKFFDWAYKSGDAAAAQLDYVPLPAAVKTLIRKQWAANITAGGKPVYVSR
jgi:phosphate transport system substrate-binding protein